MSSGKLAPNTILGDIVANSSGISKKFFAAAKTRSRVESSLMLWMISVLTDAASAHRRMRHQIDTDVVDTGTSVTTALLILFESLADMVRGHASSSIALADNLDTVYFKHVDYLVKELSTQLQDCDRLIADAHYISTVAQSSAMTSKQATRLVLIRDTLADLSETIDGFYTLLHHETRKSRWHHFPNPLKIDNCEVHFNLLNDQEKSPMRKLADTYIKDLILSNNSRVQPNASRDAVIIEFRSAATYLAQCLLDYKQELDTFKNWLHANLSKLQTEVDYEVEPPTTSLVDFHNDGEWLESIASRYVTNSLSKLELAALLRTNGSQVLTNTDRLYSELDQLFSKLSSFIDAQEEDVISFYSNLMQQVASLQRYMLPNDTALEMFMRRLSIWRMPILNFQKSQFSKDSREVVISPIVSQLLDGARELIYDLKLKIQNDSSLLTKKMSDLLTAGDNYLTQTQVNEVFVSDNFLTIDIYYGQLRSSEVEQKEAYDVGSFFSDFGGYFGLFLGGSVISAMEIVDMIIYNAMLKATSRKKSTDTSTHL